MPLSKMAEGSQPGASSKKTGMKPGGGEGIGSVCVHAELRFAVIIIAVSPPVGVGGWWGTFVGKLRMRGKLAHALQWLYNYPPLCTRALLSPAEICSWVKDNVVSLRSPRPLPTTVNCGKIMITLSARCGMRRGCDGEVACGRCATEHLPHPACILPACCSW